MARYEYMGPRIETIPQDIIGGFNIKYQLKMDSSCVKYVMECMDFYIQE